MRSFLSSCEYLRLKEDPHRISRMSRLRVGKANLSGFGSYMITLEFPRCVVVALFSHIPAVIFSFPTSHRFLRSPVWDTRLRPEDQT